MVPTEGDAPPRVPQTANRRDLQAYEHLLERLSGLAQALGAARELREAMRPLLAFVRASAPCNGLFVSLYEPERHERTCVYAWSEGEEVDVSTLPPLPLTGSPPSRAIATGEVVVSRDHHAETERLPHVALGYDRDPRPPRSSISVPMAVLGRVIGAFVVQSVERDAYGPEQVTALRMAGGLAAMAMENVRLLEQERAQRLAAERAAAAQRLLADAGTALASSLELEETLGRLARLAVASLADLCVVDLEGEEGALRRVAVAHRDLEKDALAQQLLEHYPPDPERHRVATRVHQTHRPELMAEITDEQLRAASYDEAHFQLLCELGVRSAAVAPLVARGRMLGVLTLAAAQPGRFGEAELVLAAALADRSALAIDNARLYRRAQEAIRARDEFLSIASHELKTPVTGITGTAQLLLRAQQLGRLDPDKLGRLVRALAQSADRLGALTHDLLDVARLRAGHLPLRLTRVELAGILGALIEREREQTGEIGQPFALALPGQPCPVEADPDRLEQVLLNLLDNARKYSPDGGAIRVTLEARDGGYTLAVQDHGIGLPTGAEAQIFEPFGRAPNATERHIPGMGLGLHICREIVERHGGRIWAESPGEGRGTTVSLWLPAAT